MQRATGGCGAAEGQILKMGASVDFACALLWLSDIVCFLAGEDIRGERRFPRVQAKCVLR